MRAKTLLLACLVFGGLPASALAQSRAVLLTLPAPSTWKSQGGTLHVTAVTNGAIQGTFISSDPACGQMPVPVVGRVQGGNISFGATFPACNALMTWRGRLSGRAIGTGLVRTSLRPDGSAGTDQLGGNLFAQQ